MTVGNDKRRGRAADGDGINEEGKDGKGDMVTAMRVPVDEEGEGGTGHGVNEGGVRRRG